MTKRQTRAFFYGVTGLFSLVFIGLTIDSHRQFDRLTHSDRITPAVRDGKHIWHRSVGQRGVTLSSFPSSSSVSR